MKKKIMKLLKGEANLIDVWHYIVGTYRYALYYNKWFGEKPPLMRLHIWEQINYRIKVMNPECYKRGECIKCGCATTALQMANKSCDKPCYPEMMNRSDWKHFERRGTRVDKHGVWIWIDIEDKHKLYKETPTGYVQAN